MSTDFHDTLNRLMPAAGDFPACFAFSIHKAGSSLMHSMIAAVCNKTGIPSISIPDILFVEGIVENEWQNDPGIARALTDGRVYLGFRALPPLLQVDDSLALTRKSVLLVRDPRDALVSQYYSFGGKHLSHRLPTKNTDQFLERTKATADLEIDEYVLTFAPQYLAKLRAYRDHLDFSTVLLRRYEDIFFDKRNFLEEIFRHFGLQVDADAIREVAEAHDIRPATEQVGQHIRKGTPGDHREKLQPATIARLDEMFREIGLFYGYGL